MQHKIASSIAQLWSTTPTCRVCKRTFNPPGISRLQVYCSQACRQGAYRARGISRQARAAATELRRTLISLNDDFANRVLNLAAAIDRVDHTGTGGPGGLPTGWETEVSRTARDLREMLDRIQHIAVDHCQLAYRNRSAMKRLGPSMPISAGTYRDIVA